MKALLLLLCCTLVGTAQAQVLNNPDQAQLNRLGLVFAPLQAADTDSGTVVSARVQVSPLQAAAVIARFGGVLESWQVEPGTAVEAGTVLGTVRSTAVLDLQQSWLEANAALTLASSAHDRDQRLFDAGVIAALRLQQTAQELQAARARVAALDAQLTLAGLDADMQLHLGDSAAVLGIYTLRAPGPGVIGRLEVGVGQAVSVDQTLVLLGAARLWLEAKLPAALAAGLETGQTLRVPSVTTPLILRQIDRQLDPRTQTLGIRAEFTAPVALRAGEIVPLVLSPTQSGWRIPAAAVVHNGTQTEVFVRTAAGIESRVLQLRPLGADYLAETGLNGDELLVVRGAALLKGVALGLGGE